MVAILRHQDQARLATGTLRFEGREIGAPVSFFLVHAGPGSGSGVHVHPYAETWVVRGGEAEFTVGAERTLAGPGDIVVAPAHVPHRFVNVGAGSLELICIHPCETIEQRNL